VLVFGPDGRILWVYGNSPGNCHDSSIAEPLYCLLMETCDSDDGPFRIAADSAFKNAGDLTKYIFKPLKSDALARMANDAEVSVDELAKRITQHRSCVSVRQAAEWGMGSLQRDFCILRGPLPVDAAERRLILDAVVLLHNFRCVVARCPNQIRTTFEEAPPRWNPALELRCSRQCLGFRACRMLRLPPSRPLCSVSVAMVVPS
jgi:hypothetical protein